MSASATSRRRSQGASSRTSTLADARHLTLLSKIHYLATTAADGRAGLDTVKQLIEDSGVLDLDSPLNSSRSHSSQNHSAGSAHLPSPMPQPCISPPSFGSAHKAEVLSPPASDSDSLPDVLHPSDQYITDRNHNSSRDSNNNNSSSRSKSNFNSNNNNNGNGNCNSNSNNNNNNSDLLNMASVSIRDKDDPAMKAPSASDHMSGDASRSDGDYDDEEFTLEEELEGIADAPVKERAAMRRALHAKQLALDKQMRQSAADKRRIAVEEGLRIQRTLLRDQRPVTPSSYPSGVRSEPHRDSASHSSSRPRHVTTQKPSAHYSKTPPSEDTEKGEAPAVALPVPVPAGPLVPIDTSDDDDTTSGRFGMAFDPSSLDEATADRISGVLGDKDARRSVLIQSIPAETTVHELLAHIRGGPIVSVKLAPDLTGRGNSQTAMVTFTTSKEAHACIELSASLVSRSDLASKLRIGLLSTASYPSSDVLPAVARPGMGIPGLSVVVQPTRCLSVDNFPPYLVDKLCIELSLSAGQQPNKLHVLEDMWFDHNTLVIHFTSVQEAKKAHAILTLLHYGRYRNDVHYAPDPCASTQFAFSPTGAVELASHGHQGLKSLLESVGLTAYARNQEEQYVQKMGRAPVVAAAAAAAVPRSVSVHRAASTAPPVVAPPLSQTSLGQSRLAPTSVPSVPSMTSMTNDTASLLMSIDSGMYGSETTQGEVHDARALDGCTEASPVVNMGSLPWTDTLMAGLDML